MQKDAERMEEYEERRDIFYGNADRKGRTRRPPRFFLFGQEDLDNEEIISMVELTPTYKRSKEALTSIKSKAFNNMAIEPESATAVASGASAGSVISFN